MSPLLLGASRTAGHAHSVLKGGQQNACTESWAEGTARSKTVGIHEEQQSRASVMRGEIRQAQVFVGHGKSSFWVLCDWEGKPSVQKSCWSGLHLERVTPAAEDTRQQGGKDRRGDGAAGGDGGGRSGADVL